MTGKLQRLKQLTRESMEPAETRPGDPELEGGPFGPNANRPGLALPLIPPAERGPQCVDVTRLRFHPEQQPRDMLTSADWERLLAEDANDPSGTLGALERAAADRVESQRVLEHVRTLASSIRSLGVLVPLLVLSLEDSDTLLVIDGHCRAMGAVAAGVAEVPVTIEAREGSDEGALALAARRFLLNDTQQKLNPLEAMREVERLMDLALKVVAAQSTADTHTSPDPSQGHPTDESAPEDDGHKTLAGDLKAPEVPELLPEPGVSPDLDPFAPLRQGQTRAGLQRQAARRLVLEKTGITADRFETLYRLRNLHPEAKALAGDLSENHLRALLGAPFDTQPLLVRLVRATSASVSDTRKLSRHARDLGTEYIQRLLDQALRQTERKRQRTSVSWAALLNAVPSDVNRRISSLRAELAALPDELRGVRLEQLRTQRDLASELVRGFEEILQLYDPHGSE